MATSKNFMSVQINGRAIDVQVVSPPKEVKTIHIEPTPQEVFSPADLCIYCGRTDALTDEHLIPYGLSGREVLRRASCSACARETGRFEQLVLRGPMRAARIHRRLKSRTKHSNASTTQRAYFETTGRAFEVDLPLSEYPILLNFPIFSPPGYFTGQASPGISMIGVNVVLFGPRPEQVAKAHGAQTMRFPTTTEQPIAFGRMLAKIAYGYAFARGALDLIDGPSFVVPCILGKSDDVGQWVFTDASEVVTYPGVLHRVDHYAMQDHLIADVHLFADSQSPVYSVILGKLKTGPC